MYTEQIIMEHWDTFPEPNLFRVISAEEFVRRGYINYVYNMQASVDVNPFKQPADTKRYSAKWRFFLWRSNDGIFKGYGIGAYNYIDLPEDDPSKYQVVYAEVGCQHMWALMDNEQQVNVFGRIASRYESATYCLKCGHSEIVHI